MDRQREVLVGKLAIGRGMLKREMAVRCFHGAAGREPFWEVAVRAGFLARSQVDELLSIVERGVLVCRGKCGARYPLRATHPDQTERCSRCGGALYVLIPEGRPQQEPDFSTGTGEKTQPMPGPATAAGAAAIGRAASAPPPSPRANGGYASDEAPTIPPPHARKKAPARDEDFDSPSPSFAIPSAIPIPAPLSAAVPSFSDRKTQEAPAATEEEAFSPFMLDNYEVLAPIGKGGMGSVYKARQRSLDRLVAIKILTIASEDQRARFDREIKATAALNHPNIVRVLGGGIYVPPGEEEGRPYFAMEFVLGRDLGKWSREAPRSAGLCAAMAVTICDAMHYAHNRGIIHRDLKPQNVLVTFDGDVPKVCDFGLAKVAESNLTRTGDVMGTPQYMPPEQILGDRKMVGPPSDVYAIGAVLYHLLAGVPPFHSKKIFALTAMVVKDPPAPLRVKNPSVPAKLEAAVLKALEKDPTKRFHTARDFGRELASLGLPK